MSFVQIIEYATDHHDEIEMLMDRWTELTEGKRTAIRALHSVDRDRPGTYIDIVEFPSYEEAMHNSSLPETTEISSRMAKLCDAQSFRNLDVLRDDQL